MTFKYSGICPVCGKKGTKKNEHHIRKYAVWGEGETIFVCVFPCHLALDMVIKKKEDARLRQFPEIYDDTLQDFLDGKINPHEIVRGKSPQKKRKRKRNGKRRINSGT